MIEADNVEECPIDGCDARFIGMSPKEWRTTHASEDCEKAPLAALIYFPEEGEKA